eukprot:s336_g18.t1
MQSSEEFVTQCCTCGRGACNKHGSWEVGQFHCALCHGNDDPLLSGAKDTFAIRCLNKAFQNQKLLHTNDEAFHDFMLMLCAERRNPLTEAAYSDEEFFDAQPQEAASAVLTWEDAKQLVAAIVLSRLGTAEDAAKVLGQSWVPTWDGWKELQRCTTESCCVAIAERMCDIAQVNAPDRSMTDTQALKALAADGFMRQRAKAHGVNNCLIDSLMLCLSNECILPENLATDVAARRCVAAACRKQLIQEVGKAVAPSDNGLFPYLDAHRDGPRIVAFLLQRFRAAARTNMLIYVHDRFGECTVDPDRNKIFVDLGFEHPELHALQLHIYNHTSAQGRGYHFDSLVHETTARQMAPTGKRCKSIAWSDAKETDAKPDATTLQGNELQQKQANSRCSMSKKLCDNMDETVEDVDQRTEVAFAQMGWLLCESNVDTSWLDALLLNLLFHGYLSLGPFASPEVRYQLCKTCQTHLLLERKLNREEEQTLNLQTHLASAIAFFVRSSGEDANAEVYVHDATTTDLNAPRNIYSIGRSDTLLAPIFRLYCYENGSYAALLPAAQTLPQQTQSMPASSSSRRETPVAHRTAKEVSGESIGNMEPARDKQLQALSASSLSGKETSDAYRTGEQVTGESIGEMEQARDILQRFCDSHGAKVQISNADVHRLNEVWSDKDAGGIFLHTLMQAGLTFADGGMHHARRVVDQFRAFWNCCTQGAGQRLAAAPAPAAKGDASNHLPPTVFAQPQVQVSDERSKPTPKKLSDEGSKGGPTKKRIGRRHAAAAMKIAKEVKKASARKGKRKRLQREVSPSTSKNRNIAVPIRRVRQKTAPETSKEDIASGGLLADSTAMKTSASEDGDIYLLRLWKPCQGNQDPRAAYDVARNQAAALLCEKPTLPERFQTASDPGKAYDLSDFHCAFRGCGHECATESALAAHIVDHHGDALRSLSLHWSAQVPAPKATFEAYQAALTWHCRQLAPIANCSIDRRCLRRLRMNLLGKQVGAAICFVCARRFPFLQGYPNQQITRQQAFDQQTGFFFGQSAESLEQLLGFDTYHARYISTLPADTQTSLQSELSHWTCSMSCPSYQIRIVACPEDKTCGRRCPMYSVCTQCEVPLCSSCWNYIYRHRSKPPEALSNDMLLGHPPREIYAQECTVLELLCASPCMTALTCFSIERRCLQDRSLAQDAFMNRHRLCAKGNATTFPLPWEDLLSEFERLDGKRAAKGVAPLLPHVGKGQHVIHQAVVRRTVVVRLIATMVARHHPAYTGVDMSLVESRAEMLPENDVPAEIIALLDNDGSLNQVLRQKAATPFNDQMSEEQAGYEFGRLLKPNAVVMEKTSAGYQDLNAHHVSALEEIVTRSQPTSAQPLPEVTLYTGTKLLDQFQPLYFALAFPFVFPYGIGLPDVPKWSKRERFRRDAEDPYVELNTWVKVMARRIEAQVSRDWVFGFTSWNLLFRSALNLSRTTDAYSRSFYDEETQEWVQPTGKHVELAAQQLLLALKGSYIDVTGQPRPVKGDVSKLRYVQGLKPMARKLLTNMRHTAQGLPGTQEARKRMRFEIQAMRIRYGVPLFVTYTPDEAHQLLFVRMTRVRASDPVRAASVGQDFPAGDLLFPDLGTKNAAAPGPFEYEFSLPMSWAERREVLARDPLAAVDGFRPHASNVEASIWCAYLSFLSRL